jgi:hypothetical protein
MVMGHSSVMVLLGATEGPALSLDLFTIMQALQSALGQSWRGLAAPVAFCTFIHDRSHIEAFS